VRNGELHGDIGAVQRIACDPIADRRRVETGNHFPSPRRRELGDRAPHLTHPDDRHLMRHTPASWAKNAIRFAKEAFRIREMRHAEIADQ